MSCKLLFGRGSIQQSEILHEKLLSQNYTTAETICVETTGLLAITPKWDGWIVDMKGFDVDAWCHYEAILTHLIAINSVLLKDRMNLVFLSWIICLCAFSLFLSVCCISALSSRLICSSRVLLSAPTFVLFTERSLLSVECSDEVSFDAAVLHSDSGWNGVPNGSGRQPSDSKSIRSEGSSIQSKELDRDKQGELVWVATDCN